MLGVGRLDFNASRRRGWYSQGLFEGSGLVLAYRFHSDARSRDDYISYVEHFGPSPYEGPKDSLLVEWSISRASIVGIVTVVLRRYLMAGHVPRPGNCSLTNPRYYLDRQRDL